MANIASAKKRARQTIERRAHNVTMRSRVRTYIKNVLLAIRSGDKAKAVEAFKAAQPVIDSMARKNQIHPNKAARAKSRLNARLKAMA